MNRNQIKGNWLKVKGRARHIWAGLTDDEVERAKGDVDKLYGIIQGKYGDAKESIKKKIDQLP